MKIIDIIIVLYACTDDNHKKNSICRGVLGSWRIDYCVPANTFRNSKIYSSARTILIYMRTYYCSHILS